MIPLTAASLVTSFVILGDCRLLMLVSDYGKKANSADMLVMKNRQAFPAHFSPGKKACLSPGTELSALALLP